jgi:hypothetical protein
MIQVSVPLNGYDDAGLQAKQVIVTRAVAAHFFPDGAVGKQLYVNDSRRLIVGVIDYIAVVGPGFDLAPDDPKYAFLLPGDPRSPVAATTCCASIPARSACAARSALRAATL